MRTTSYKIHLPSGTVITAKNHTELDKILSLNVCRIYQSRQIRIEPVFDRGETSVIRRVYRMTYKALLRRQDTTADKPL